MRNRTSLWSVSNRDWRLTRIALNNRFSEDQAKTVICNVEKQKDANKSALDALKTVQDERQMARPLS